MSLILLALVLSSAFVVITILIINSRCFTDAKDATEYLSRLRQVPIQGTIYRIASYVLAASSVCFVALRLFQRF